MLKPNQLRAALKGIQVVLVTPMKEDFSLDLDGLAANIRDLLRWEIHGLIVAGTYGEYPTLSGDERTALFETAAQAAESKVPVIGCVAHSSTREAAALAERGARAGLDGVMIAPPFGSEAQPIDVINHFKTVARATDIGNVIYNDPGIGAYMQPPLLGRVVDEVDNICGAKVGATDVREMDALTHANGRKIAVICGSDTMMITAYGLGMAGVTSSKTGPFPELLTQTWKLLTQDRITEARRLHEAWRPYRELSARCGEPATMKVAQEMRGRAGGPVRPPLHSLSASEREEVRALVQMLTEVKDTKAA